MEITKDKITEIFCIIDDFCKEYDAEIEKMAIPEPNGRKHRKRKWAMSRSEIMAVLNLSSRFILSRTQVIRYFVLEAELLN